MTVSASCRDSDGGTGALCMTVETRCQPAPHLGQIPRAATRRCPLEQPIPELRNIRMPNVARIYDFLLGGKDNFEEDRNAARQLLDAVPDAAVAAWDNREFLGRAVRFLAEEAGIRQFIDIGTGLPT